MVISAHLEDNQIERLLSVLHMHYGALEWNMADVKGMDPLILYASLDKCNVNPTIQEVVQTDILNFSTLALSINSRLQVDESNPSCFQKSKVTVAQNKD